MNHVSRRACRFYLSMLHPQPPVSIPTLSPMLKHATTTTKRIIILTSSEINFGPAKNKMLLYGLLSVNAGWCCGSLRSHLSGPQIRRYSHTPLCRTFLALRMELCRTLVAKMCTCTYMLYNLTPRCGMTKYGSDTGLMMRNPRSSSWYCD